MKTLICLKTVMSLIAEEENTNKYLIAALQYAQTPDVNTAPQVKVINAPSTSQPLIVYLHACFPATSVKLQSIHQNNEKTTTSDDYQSWFSPWWVENVYIGT